MLRVLLISVLVVIVVALGVVVAIVVLLKRVVRDVQVGLDDLRRETLPLLDQTRSALSQDRKTDALLDAATSLTGTADAATRFAYRMLTNPFVKLLAFLTGTKRGVRSLAEKTAPTGPAHRSLSRAEARRRAITVRDSTETQPRSEAD